MSKEKEKPNNTTYNSFSKEESDKINKYFKDQGNILDDESKPTNTDKIQNLASQKSLFTKSYSILDNFTPHIKAYLYVDWIDNDNNRKKLKLDLFKGLNNNIQNFTLETKSGSGTGTLKLVDINGTILEILLMNFYAAKASNGVGYPEIEIEYGWTLPDNIDGWGINRKSGALIKAISNINDMPPIIFKNKVKFIASEIETDFKLPLNATIKGTVTDLLTEQNIKIKNGPYEYFGTTMPLLHLSYIYVYGQFEEILKQKLMTSNKKEETIKNLILQIFPKEKTIEKIDKNHRNKIANFKEIDLIKEKLNIKVNNNETELLEGLIVTLFNMSQEDKIGILNDLHTHYTLFNKIKVDAKAYEKIKFYNDFSIFFYDIFFFRFDAQASSYELKKSLFDKEYIEKFKIDIDKLEKDYVIFKKKDLSENAIANILKIFSPSFKIHPFDAYIYFYEHYKKESKSEVESLFMFGEKDNKGNTNEKIDAGEAKKILGYIKSADFEETKKKENDYIINSTNIRGADLTISPGYSWVDLFRKTLSQVKYGVDTIDEDNKIKQIAVPLEILCIKNDDKNEEVKIDENSYNSSDDFAEGNLSLNKKDKNNTTASSFKIFEQQLLNYIEFYTKYNNIESIQDKEINSSDKSLAEKRKLVAQLFQNISTNLKIFHEKIKNLLIYKKVEQFLLIYPKKNEISLFKQPSSLSNVVLQSYSILAPRSMSSEYFQDASKGIRFNNIPDVIEFTPEINFDSLMSGIQFKNNNNQTTTFIGDTDAIRQNIKLKKNPIVKPEEIDIKKAELTLAENLNSIINNKDNNIPNTFILKNKEEEGKIKDNQLKKIYEEYKSAVKAAENISTKGTTEKDAGLIATFKYHININTLNKIIGELKGKLGTENPEPVTFSPLPFLASSSDLGDPGSRSANLVGAKNKLQTIRKELMKQNLAINAKLKIFGEPAYDSTLLGGIDNYIFLRVYNIDGSESIFTGLYLLTGVTHELGGSYTTTLQLQRTLVNNYDSTVGSVQKFVN